MKSSLESWRNRTAYKLSEAALLITSNDPDSWTDEKLFTTPPNGFKAIYGQMLIDATTVINEAVESQEYDGVYFTEYALMTDKPAKLNKLTDKDGLTVMVEKHDLLRWLKFKKISSKFFDQESLTEFVTTDSSETTKPLSTRERNTLLVIIAALAKEAKIDIGTPSKAGGIIASLTEEMGAAVDSETIAGKLKLIPDALESRTK